MEVDEAAARLVRDVFVAADVVHADAMSEVGGSTQNDGDWVGDMEASEEDPLEPSTDSSIHAGSSNKGDEEGEWWLLQSSNA